jgi:hypothetical protein
VQEEEEGEVVLQVAVLVVVEAVVYPSWALMDPIL